MRLSTLQNSHFPINWTFATTICNAPTVNVKLYSYDFHSKKLFNLLWDAKLEILIRFAYEQKFVTIFFFTSEIFGGYKNLEPLLLLFYVGTRNHTTPMMPWPTIEQRGGGSYSTLLTNNPSALAPLTSLFFGEFCSEFYFPIPTTWHKHIRLWLTIWTSISISSNNTMIWHDSSTKVLWLFGLWNDNV